MTEYTWRNDRKDKNNTPLPDFRSRGHKKRETVLLFTYLPNFYIYVDLHKFLTWINTSCRTVDRPVCQPKKIPESYRSAPRINTYAILIPFIINFTSTHPTSSFEIFLDPRLLHYEAPFRYFIFFCKKWYITVSIKIDIYHLFKRVRSPIRIAEIQLYSVSSRWCHLFEKVSYKFESIGDVISSN